MSGVVFVEMCCPKCGYKFDIDKNGFPVIQEGIYACGMRCPQCRTSCGDIELRFESNNYGKV